MAQKTVDIAGAGTVTLVKRRGSRNIRLSYARDGSVRVSLPYYLPYQVGVEFVESKLDWLAKHRPPAQAALQTGDRIGKAHRVKIAPGSGSKVSVRLTANGISVTHPLAMPDSHKEVQKAAERGALKALKKEADQLLPGRLEQLAAKYGFTFASVNTKRLGSRWGSCSQHKDITLNTYLMQLPWNLIDYVILHELTHTEHLNHSAGFWSRLESILPDAKKLRRELKTHRTAIQPS